MKIAIITATYQCAPTVGACLESVAAQTYPDREQIVIDGASPDGTLAVLRARQAQLAALVSEPTRRACATAGCRPIRPCICAGRYTSGWGASIPAIASRRIMT